MGSAPASAVIAVDASLAVRAVLPFRAQADLLDRFRSWHQAHARLCAPAILLPEAVSVILQAVFEGWINEAGARDAVEDLFRLGLEILDSDPALCHAALVWARRRPTTDSIWPRRRGRLFRGGFSPPGTRTVL
jgi:predicted nucleic acid-binding protein